MKRASNMKSRVIAYCFAAALILAVNGNVLADPIAARIAYINSHRRSVAKVNGQWDTLSKENPVRSIHAALLRTGKVMLIAGSGNNQEAFDNKTFRTVLWDPKTNEFTDVPTPWDAFCAGHAFLPDGSLLVAGGTALYENLLVEPKIQFEGLKDSYIFDPVTERYRKVDSMDLARWYPTLANLGDGRIISVSGLDDKGEILQGQTEIFDPATEKWTEYPNLNRYFPTYPYLQITNDGRLFYSGSTAGYGPAEAGRQPGLWNLNNNTFQNINGLKQPDVVEYSTTVMLPPAQDQKFMLIGGGGVGDSQVATTRTAIVDVDVDNPTYTDGPDLQKPSRYPGAVILPDDTVLTALGSNGYRKNNNLIASVYNPKTNTMKDVASPTIGRNYHAEAILLPDGRVAVFGSNPLDNSFEMRIEIFSPSYLFQDGDRPSIFYAPTELTRGNSFHFTTSTPNDISSAKLIRPSAVTHVTDAEQRSINLPITKSKKGVTVDIPANQNLVPAGWYMAFVTNSNNVPSEAYWVHVN